MDVLELLAAESAVVAPAAGFDMAGQREIIADKMMNELLKEYAVMLTVHENSPGEDGQQYTITEQIHLPQNVIYPAVSVM